MLFMRLSFREKCFYRVNPLIQSEYGKIRTRKNFIYGHFSRSVLNVHSTKNFTIEKKHRVTINKNSAKQSLSQFFS